MRRNVLEKFRDKTILVHYYRNETITGTMERTNGIYLIITQTNGTVRHAYIAKINAVVELDKTGKPIESTRFTNY